MPCASSIIKIICDAKNIESYRHKIFAITLSLASNYNACISAVLVDQLSSYSCIWSKYHPTQDKCTFGVNIIIFRSFWGHLTSFWGQKL